MVVGAVGVLSCVGLYAVALAILIRASSGPHWRSLVSSGIALVIAVLILCVRSARRGWYSSPRISAISSALCLIVCVITIMLALAAASNHNELNGELLAAAVFLGIAPVLILVGARLLGTGDGQGATPSGRLPAAVAKPGEALGAEDALVATWQSVRQRQCLPGMRLWWVESAEDAGDTVRLLCSDPRGEVTQTVVVHRAPVEQHSWIVVDEVRGVVVERASNAARRAWIAGRLRA